MLEEYIFSSVNEKIKMVKLISSLAILFATVCIAAKCSEAIERTEIVQLEHGKVRGYVQTLGEEKVELFQGIRYGEAKRFEKPHPVSPWSEVLDVDSYRAGCPQFGGDTQSPFNQTKIFDEDCLYLNVWRPATKSAKMRPVMVWIHGGGFETGTSFSSMYDASNIALKGDLITVSLNYRLGVLGFAYGGGIPANLGLHDQILALKWVRENIKHFGGDPSQVTVYGESAGSISIGALILSPLTAGLFKRAIMQSGAPTMMTSSLNVQAKKTHILARKVNCSDFETNLETAVKCLQTKSVAELQEGSKNDLTENRFFTPSYGDELLPTKPDVLLKEGKFNREIDLMFGVTRDEGTMFVPMFFPEFILANLSIESTKQYIIRAMKHFDQSLIAEEVADYYLSKLSLSADQNELKATVGAALGDLMLTCPTILFGEQFAKSAKSESNQYHSYRLMQTGVSFPGIPAFKWAGVTHAQDLIYLFLNPQTEKNATIRDLSNNMVKGWVSFAKTGNPGKLGPAQWEKAFLGGNGVEAYATRYMHLESSQYKMVDGYFKKLCDAFWKSKLLD